MAWTAFFEEMAEQISDIFGSEANYELSSGLDVFRFCIQPQGGLPQPFKVLATRRRPCPKNPSFGKNSNFKVAAQQEMFEYGDIQAKVSSYKDAVRSTG